MSVKYIIGHGKISAYIDVLEHPKYLELVFFSICGAMQCLLEVNNEGSMQLANQLEPGQNRTGGNVSPRNL